jgi:tripartite-type tricarboxylate transporter receptor subunit TctC
MAGAGQCPAGSMAIEGEETMAKRTDARSTRARATRRRVLAGAVGALSLPVAASVIPAFAAWPEKPIKFVVPFAPGGPADVAARVVSVPLAQSLGQSVFIENRAGAGGNIGIGAVAKADPDGYTFLVTSGAFGLNPAYFDKVPYDALADFASVIEIAVSPNTFVSTPDSGVASIKDLVAKVRAEPDKHSYGTPGVGTQAHFAGELLKVREKLVLAHVSHQGAGPAVQSFLSGAIKLGVTGLPPVHPHIKSGKLKALAVTSAVRWHDLPEVPTMLDLGYKDFVVDVNFSMFAPAKTPAEIVARMAKETDAALKLPEIRSKMTSGGFAVTALGPAALRAKTEKELAFWRDVVKQTGVRAKP